VLAFFYDVNGNLCCCAKEEEVCNVGPWEAVFDAQEKKWFVGETQLVHSPC
jgi:hypothetical protein